MKIDDDLITYLGELSRLELGADERGTLAHDLGDILGYVDKLNELDTAGAPEMTHPFSAVNRFRDDVQTNSDRRGEMLANAPERKGDYYKVFKTVEE
ncbi:MAG: Asp-tRNA(Asn)/Glu-tRNA(Gln) amidotransferase subunit GatC [Clostridiales Family XIII bacterium]|jgi:aspartyl-tRNA(Asn)/glutamyl-tRNA(Gln) amidotransferase subunit C|nr:Asp-tRNA(Asn)/Glu-tRNA(Gln) amidotransferase subunit GatC [Clostridiales Family XIII bacterium]